MDKNEKCKQIVSSGKICIIAFTALLFLRCIYSNIFISNDFYFLSATGKYIVDNHTIPDTNPFFIFKDKPFVVQQWLYCTYCYFLSLCGNIGIWISILLFGTILTVLLYKLFRIKGESPLISCVFSAITLSISKDYMLNIRPECITVILLLLQVYFLEKYKKTEKHLWLMLIPILMILEINIHSSMWFMHYCLLIPYTLPFGLGSRYDYRKSEISFKVMIFPVMMTTIAIGLNPYGYKVVTYTFDALLSNTFQVLPIVEMMPLYYSETIIEVISLMILGIYSFKKKYLPPSSIYICSGLTVMMWLAIRNTMFLPILCFYLFTDFANGFSFKKYITDIKFDKSRVDMVKSYVKKHKSGLLKTIKAGLKLVLSGCCALCIVSTFLIGAKVQNFYQYGLWSKEVDDIDLKNTEEIKNYLDGNADKDIRLLCQIEQGGYYEACGYQNVYIDVRPELFHYPVMGAIGNESVLEEYSRLYYENDNLNGKNTRPYSDKETEQILEVYRFDYIIAESKCAISKYLNKSDMYEEIEFTGNAEKGVYHLYARKK